MKVRFHYNYPINIDIDTDKDVDVFIDKIDISPIPDNNIRIVILEEPRKGELYDIVKKDTSLYTHLLTFQEDLLATNPKAIRFLCMNTWVRNYVSGNKKFNVSTIVGGKDDAVMEGYAKRHDLWRNRQQIIIPKEFYLSGSTPYVHVFVPWAGADYTGQLVLGASKLPLFDSQFHVAIESTSIKNYFSEKILDCFQSRTVPIYCGCTNIGDFFNINGIIIANNVRDIILACNTLTGDTYNSMLPYLEDNFNRSLKWVDHQEQIKIGVTQILNEYV